MSKSESKPDLRDKELVIELWKRDWQIRELKRVIEATAAYFENSPFEPEVSKRLARNLRTYLT